MCQTYEIKFQFLPIISEELNGFSLVNCVKIQKFLLVPHYLWYCTELKPEKKISVSWQLVTPTKCWLAVFVSGSQQYIVSSRTPVMQSR